MLFPKFLAMAMLATASANNEPAPYQISVDPKLIKEAAIKARLYRPSLPLEDGTSETWREGPPTENMTALASYWANDYDWLERSERPDAIPLLLLHGWPSTYTEWNDILKPLTAPQDENAPAFHVVAPDSPGFGFSPAPTHTGFGPRQAGAAWANLMSTLGYDKYGIVSTDFGWWVALFMVDDDKDHIVGHFTDFHFAQPTPADIERYNNNQTDQLETEYIASVLAFQGGFNAYMVIQGQGPLKLGQALNDSPVGYAGWIWHLCHFGSDGYPYTLKQVVTRTLLLWIPGAYGNLRAYLEWLRPESSQFPKSDVPTGVSQWGGINGPFEELVNFPLAPPRWIERTSNLTFLVRRDFGGHFPAEQYPDLYVKDVQDFFGQLDA
ncbi:epoxide hydrolase [Microdochium trichocladiopsis]|uniref:Epoxide hydrolase n=1 Tax=Microdochium trichocladiopsis TaxID=1682393 RepID=A0A9P8XXR9_9PEZI|nr:epoxide hydrolase [Microdochium trichocladiopsis]KAH7018403.1 epoxide hydrolase [Microdochium trichocladiopsis]